MSKYHERPNIYVKDLVLKVEDIERSKEFYTEIMGFKALDTKENEVVLTANDKDSILTIIEPDDIRPKLPRRTGLYHFAILLPSRIHLGMFLKHIKDKGYPITGGSNHGVSEAVYLEDPDDNGIEIYRDVDSEGWQHEGEEIKMVTLPLDYNEIMNETNGQTWQGMPEETIIGHIHLHVSDLDESKKFYCDGLGFDVVMKMTNSALFISTGGYHHHIGLNIWNGKGALPLPEDSVGMKYYTLVMPDADIRDEKINKLKSLGYEIIEKDDDIYTKDPSDNLMKLMV